MSKNVAPKVVKTVENHYENNLLKMD